MFCSHRTRPRPTSVVEIAVQTMNNPTGNRISKNGGRMDLPHRRNIVNDHDPEQCERHDGSEGTPSPPKYGRRASRASAGPRIAIVASSISRLCAAGRRRSRRPVHASTAKLTALLKLPQTTPLRNCTTGTPLTPIPTSALARRDPERHDPARQRRRQRHGSAPAGLLAGEIKPGERINVAELERTLRRQPHPDPRGRPQARDRGADRRAAAARGGRGRRRSRRSRRALRPAPDRRVRGDRALGRRR